MNAVGVTSAVGVAIGGTTAVVAGAAAGLARGAVVAALGGHSTATAALEDQQADEGAVGLASTTRDEPVEQQPQPQHVANGDGGYSVASSLDPRAT